MKKHLSNFTKKHRWNKIKKIQNQIALEKVKEILGQEIEVLVDYFDESTGEYCAHSQKLSPLVDFGVRFVDNGSINCGQIVKVKIYDFDGSDLKGEVV